MKHTPAPWQLAKSEESKLIKVLNKYGTRIAGITPMENDEANARLIAAAPELLALLEEFDGVFSNVLTNRAYSKADKSLAKRMQDAARAAIAKAKGE